MKTVLSKLEEYLSISAVVGHESRFIQHLMNEYHKRTKFMTQNSLIIKGHTDKILCCHIDRHGILGTPRGHEFAAFAMKREYSMEMPSKETFYQKCAERFFEKEVVDLEGNSGFVRDSYIDTSQGLLVFDIEGNLSNLGPIMYKNGFKHENQKIIGQIDNTICAAVIYQLYEQGFDGTIIFTREEEIGNSYKGVIDYLENQNIKTNNLIVLDTTPFTDTKAIENGLVVLRKADAYSEFNTDLAQNLEEVCSNFNIQYLFKDEYQRQLSKEEGTPLSLGKTELGKVVAESKGRYNGVTIQIPSYNYHTNEETTSESCLENYLKLLEFVL